MNSTYAYAISHMISDLQFDSSMVGTDLKYIQTQIYRDIASAMWLGKTSVDVIRSRLTDGIRETLRAQGYVLRDHPTSMLVEHLSWAEQTVYDDNHEPKKVSSKQFNEFVQQLDDETIARHEARSAFD